MTVLAWTCLSYFFYIGERGTSPLLREDFYHRQKKYSSKRKLKDLLRGFLLGLVCLLVILGFAYALKSGSSGQIIGFLTKQSFPFEGLLMEGVPGFSQPQRATLDLERNQAAAVGMFLLTGVNVSDPRTFFLGYFAPPPDGPVWLGWAYNPNDPEFEGTILEPIPGEVQTPDDNSGQTSPADELPGAKEILVGIYNTHNSESYSGDGGTDREQGENGDTVTVGDSLKKALLKYGVGAAHSITIHDAVDFMKAYSKSVVTATQMTKDYPNLRLLIDVHRDGVPVGVSKSTVSVKGQQVSQVLVVIGKQNPHWQKNEAVVKEIMALAEEKYPGLFVSKISYAADARYNQHLSDGGMLLEFGDQLNTLAEANGAADAVAEIIAEWLKITP